MAVFDFVKGIEVDVQVGGGHLYEYEDDAERTEAGAGAVEEYQLSRTVHKFIRSVPPASSLFVSSSATSTSLSRHP
jgi:hypothetical protein